MSGTLSPTLTFALGGFAALWLMLGIWAAGRGLAMQRRSAFAAAQTERLASLVEASPYLPVVVRGDWRIEASERLGRWLGLERGPRNFDELRGLGAGIEAGEHEALRQAILGAQRGAKPFTMTLRPQGGSRTILVHGGPAPATIGSAGSVLLWLDDATDSLASQFALKRERDEAMAAFDALSGLIEVAPFPMWFRDPRLDLALVNLAYVKAVEAPNAAAVIEQGIELLEPVAGVSAAEAAQAARVAGAAQLRTVPVTIAGERRIMRVVDVPLAPAGGLPIGIAGYAIDVQELESERGAHRRFADTQRELLDRLSAAVAQFDGEQALVFANQPFRRMFELDNDGVAEAPPLARLLDAWRETGRIPEVRDYPEWRQAHVDWFASAEANEEDWLLRDGTHLRVVAQPTPDGGLLLIAEDRTEQVQLAGARDTLLRVRTATFDNLFEAIAVFAPDGKLHLWNQRFRRLWGVDEPTLAAHPRVDALMGGLADRLAKPNQISIVQEVIRAATMERTQRAGEILFRDGRHFDFAAIPLPDGNALLIMLDVSDNRKMEAALRDRNEALEAADKVKTAFLSRMSYELRTPLTSIGGFGEMLQAGYAGKLGDQQRVYVDAIMDSVAVLSRQIDNVLDLAQGEAGMLAVELAPVDVAGLLQRALDEAGPFAASQGVELVGNISAGLGAIQGDAARLSRLVAGLLDNAVRYTAPNRKKGGRVLLHAEGDAKGIDIIVSDNGPGLPEAVVALTKGREAGTQSGGIGLALTRQLVAAHRGTMEVMSEKGQGTLVRVSLPRGA
ncbi:MULTISPECIES: sensor histidine kinase [unclassified Sphingopyxis]|uniref:sensor histidine kinase n=1 Tax=unclassified Sphingopyxis TaxID=2614943 RepID=UPI000736FBA8|nr:MULTISPECIES: PAS domain-containing sensor histidine kinase [unclassified Sphingopyxis]KTE41931.1 histidine kinase [Sphingopyxis sp. HIX]KTE83618.1 histidine kinase [Sphingopyxis sp. HXXIV]